MIQDLMQRESTHKADLNRHSQQNNSSNSKEVIVNEEVVISSDEELNLDDEEHVTRKPYPSNNTENKTSKTQRKG